MSKHRTVVNVNFTDSFNESDHPREGGKFTNKGAAEHSVKGHEAAAAYHDKEAGKLAGKNTERQGGSRKTLGRPGKAYAKMATHEIAAAAHSDAAEALKAGKHEEAKHHAARAEMHSGRLRRGEY